MLRRCCVDVSQSFDGLLQDFLPHAEDSLSTCGGFAFYPSEAEQGDFRLSDMSSAAIWLPSFHAQVDKAVLRL